MKKFTALVLSVLMVISLAACSGGGAAETTAAPETEAAAETTAPAETDAAAETTAAAEDEMKYSARLNIEGSGAIAFAEEGETLEFDEEFPLQSAILNTAEELNYVVSAKADEGWKFVKWTKSGEDFSTEDTITITVNEDPADNVEYIAVFEEE